MARTLNELQKQYNASSSQTGAAGGFMRGPGGGPGGGGPGGRHAAAKGKPKNTKNTVKRLFKYIERYKFRLVLVVFLMLLSTVSTLFGSFLLAPIINKLALFVSPTDSPNLSFMEKFSDGIIASFQNSVMSVFDGISADSRAVEVMAYIASALVILLFKTAVRYSFS